MAYAGRHNIYEASIRRMVDQALQLQEQEFRQQHEGDTDEQLLEYLRSTALRLRHSPWPGEITGGSYLTERFGTWPKALSMARLPAPQTPNRPQSFLRIQRETERQKIVYRQRKAEKKALAEKRIALQNAKKLQSNPR